MPPCYKHAAPLGLKTCVFLSRKRVGGPNPYEQEGWGTQPLRIQFPVFPSSQRSLHLCDVFLRITYHVLFLTFHFP